MVSIPRRRMDLFHDRFAFTGAEMFADGVFTSMFATVVHSTCIIWEGRQAVPSVIVETMGIVSFLIVQSNCILFIGSVKYHRINFGRL